MKNVSKSTKRPPFSWQTVNPPVPHSSPYNIKALRLNYELTNYVLTSKTRVKESKERENSRLKMITSILRKSLTRNLRIQTEYVPAIVSQKIIIIQQRAIVGPSCA